MPQGPWLSSWLFWDSQLYLDDQESEPHPHSPAQAWDLSQPRNSPTSSGLPLVMDCISHPWAESWLPLKPSTSHAAERKKQSDIPWFGAQRGWAQRKWIHELTDSLTNQSLHTCLPVRIGGCFFPKSCGFHAIVSQLVCCASTSTAEYWGKPKQALKLQHGQHMLTAHKGEELEPLWWVLLGAGREPAGLCSRVWGLLV